MHGGFAGGRFTRRYVDFAAAGLEKAGMMYQQGDWCGGECRGDMCYVPAGSMKPKAPASTCHDCDFSIELEDVFEVL